MNCIEVTADYLRAHPLPRHRDGSKEHRGKVLIVAGSAELAGAALLAGHGALRTGAGILQIATVRSAALHIAVAMPEALVVGCDETSEGGIDAAKAQRIIDLACECDALLIGPGLQDKTSVATLTAALLAEADKPVLALDAAAFTTLDRAHSANRPGRVVVTPHSGEMASFLGVNRDAVDADPISIASRAAQELQAIVALKGAVTHIAAPNGTTWRSAHGSIGLATSGSGDTLAGILAGLLARGTDPALAAVWAVYLHPSAGQRLTERLGRYGLLARELAQEIPGIMQELSDEKFLATSPLGSSIACS